MNSIFNIPKLSRTRIIVALLTAMVADGLQIPFQVVPPVPEIIDVIAMVLTVFTLGFHVLLLPTFALELIHFVDMVPTWTGCVIAVIALRRRSQHTETAVPPLPPGSPPSPPRTLPPA